MNSSFLQAVEYQNKEERSNETQKNSPGQTEGTHLPSSISNRTSQGNGIALPNQSVKGYGQGREEREYWFPFSSEWIEGQEKEEKPDS